MADASPMASASRSSARRPCSPAGWRTPTCSRRLLLEDAVPGFGGFRERGRDVLGGVLPQLRVIRCDVPGFVLNLTVVRHTFAIHQRTLIGPRAQRWNAEHELLEHFGGVGVRRLSGDEVHHW